MANFYPLKSRTSALIALMASATTMAPIFPLPPASAQRFLSQRVSVTTTNVVIPAGTQIPVIYKDKKILVTKDETVPVTLQVATNIRSTNDTILIPYGAKIVGQIQPAGEGSQFVAQTLIVNGSRKQPLDATSQVVTRTEEIDQGTDVKSILIGTAVGASAATILAAITGDHAIATEEVLGGAGLGALAGWLLWGKKTAELISINPETDLTLTLQSDLVLK